MFESWGKENQKLPENNSVLKEEILSKVSFDVDEYRKTTMKKSSLPWFSMAFAAVAVIIFIGNFGFSTENKNLPLVANNTTRTYVDTNKKTNTEVSKVAKVKNQNKPLATANPSLKNMLSAPAPMAPGINTISNQIQEVLPDSMPVPKPTPSDITDTREFLKINYDATIKTRDVADMVAKTQTAVRGAGGRVDGVSGGEKYGYVSFSVPANQFEMFRSTIQSLTNAKFYIEQTSSTNMLPQKQVIEKQQTEVEKNITDLKTQKSKLVKDHNETIDEYNIGIDTLDTETAALNAEFPTATVARKAQITARLAQISTQQDALQAQIDTENTDFQNAVAPINKKLLDAGVSLQDVQQQDQNLLDDVSVVNGTISFNWMSLWDMANIYTSGTLLAWIFLGLAGLAYLRYRMTRVTFA